MSGKRKERGEDGPPYQEARQYTYGHKVRLAQRTDSLRLQRAFDSSAMYYDPGIKLENASTENAKRKKQRQFRAASKNIAALCETVERRFPNRPAPNQSSALRSA